MGLGGAISGVRRAGCRAAGGLASFRHAAWPALRIFLGLVLLTAAGLKAYQLASEPVLDTGLFDSRWLLIAVVEFELLLGLWLLSGLYPRASRLVAVGCFAAFAGVSLWKALSGETTCGCLGSRIAVHPWFTFAFDCLAVGLLSAVGGQCRATPACRVSGWARALGCFAALTLLGGFLGYAALVSRLGPRPGVTGNGLLLQPDQWVGKRFPVLPYLECANRLAKGRWIVVLYRHDCPKCKRAIRQYALRYRLGHYHASPARVALVDIGPRVQHTAALVAREWGVGCSLSSRMPVELFGRVPLEILLRRGTVVRVSPLASEMGSPDSR